MASPKDNEREFTMEKLSGPDNFWSWRRNMLMVLTYHDLDDLVLVVDPPISQDDIEVKKKRAAALIRLHLDAQHAFQFVDDLDKFEAKELWDAISNHYASPTLKNAHDLIELLDGIRFDKDSGVLLHCHDSQPTTGVVTWRGIKNDERRRSKFRQISIRARRRAEETKRIPSSQLVPPPSQSPSPPESSLVVPQIRMKDDLGVRFVKTEFITLKPTILQRTAINCTPKGLPKSDAHWANSMSARGCNQSITRPLTPTSCSRD
ncbi:hypothetical protein PSTT_10638 [Puccinia striiformis]|uniref:Uncharacterized protein n=1 Tax=Puccinia striiformis TaxID=27350 RepID=A0A2S4V3G6_9BASI|nr:hypothetical protein PSTT_10638 [Puccinia striiformis]